MIIPPSAITPRSATNPKGELKASSAGTTPIKPSGAVKKTIVTREKLCSCRRSADATFPNR